jgi:TRAP-type C4-dicarboxylate transport system permease small subunit
MVLALGTHGTQRIRRSTSIGGSMRRASLVKYMDRWALRVIAIAALLTVLLFLASLILIYWGDEYASPAWDERSVPAPRTY